VQEYIVTSRGRRVGKVVAESREDAVATIAPAPPEGAELKAYRFERVPAKQRRP